MAIARPIRFLIFSTILLVLYLILPFRSSSSTIQPGPPEDPGRPWRIDKSFNEPNKEPFIEPEGPLWRVDGRNYDPKNPDSDRINATILSLVRNSELDDMLQSMRDLERTFNRKFNYPWLFLNDEPFTEEFKKKISAETKAKVTFDILPKEHWAVPEWISESLFQTSVQSMTSKGVQFMGMKSYHQMCRWNSGMFYRHPLLANTKWYWRVEPKVHFFCDIDYDVFRYMETNNKTYGFTINLYDDPASVETLWPTTQKFLDGVGSKFIHPNNAMGWLKDSTHRPDNFKKANGYSTCHFWSNFEIGDMSFFRSEAYEEFFNHLDRSGGFFYERWGDAPVHSIALALFEDKTKIHWFRDIGYQHIPFFNCPNSPKCKGCEAGRLTDGELWLHRDDCRPLWFKEAGIN